MSDIITMPQEVWEGVLGSINPRSRWYMGTLMNDDEWVPYHKASGGHVISEEPRVLLDYWDGYEIQNCTIQEYIEMATEYEYEVGSFRLSETQWAQVCEIIQAQADRDNAHASGIINYITDMKLRPSKEL